MKNAVAQSQRKSKQGVMSCCKVMMNMHDVRDQIRGLWDLELRLKPPTSSPNLSDLWPHTYLSQTPEDHACPGADLMHIQVVSTSPDIIQRRKKSGLRGIAPPTSKLACFVLYHKIINICRVNWPRNSKIASKFYVTKRFLNNWPTNFWLFDL